MGTINIFPCPLAVAVYKSQREKGGEYCDVLSKRCAWGSPACRDFQFSDACVEGG